MASEKMGKFCLNARKRKNVSLEKYSLKISVCDRNNGKTREARKVESLEEYSKKLEKELSKYSLTCECDNFAGGFNDGYAMKMAHVAAAMDLLDPILHWMVADVKEQELARAYQGQIDLRGWTEEDSTQWLVMTKEKARCGTLIKEAQGGLLAFEGRNRGLFCGMKIWQTLRGLGWA